MADHVARCEPADVPYLTAFLAMDANERWADRSPETMLRTFHWFRGEGFALIVEDLLRLPASPGVIVEGFRALPDLVNSVLADRRQAVWLLPTPEFRQLAFDQRGSTWDIAGTTANPTRALHNLLERDRMFTDHLADETARLGLSAITITPATTVNQLETEVARILEI